MNDLPSFAALFGDDLPQSPLLDDIVTETSEEAKDHEEESIAFFATDTHSVTNDAGFQDEMFLKDGEIELTTNDQSMLDEEKKSVDSSSTDCPPPSPFAPGDHVYRWCKIAGIPAFHHHAIVMQVYWDTCDKIWMLHVSDFSNISLYNATAAANIRNGSRRRQNNNQFNSSSVVTSGSNPFSNRSEPGSLRSYATPATKWHKVIYQANFWQQITNPSAGTCTRVECDPPGVVVARMQFLQLHSATLLSDKPYHWLYNNCEAAAVWCKTGRFCTLQALNFLTAATMGQVKSTALIAGTAAATQVTVTATAPAAGIWGAWFGMTVTTTTQLPLLVTQPYLIPAIAGYGLVAIGVPTVMILNAKKEWNIITESLNGPFWSDYALQEPEVFVEFIQHYFQRRKQLNNSHKQNRNPFNWRKIHQKPGKKSGKRRKPKTQPPLPGLAVTILLSVMIQMMWVVNGAPWMVLTSQARTKFAFGAANVPRGGATSKRSEAPYLLLAKIVQDKFSQQDNLETERHGASSEELANTLSKLAASQKTFKSLDGIAHEAYQRTHTTDDISDVSVRGRAQRSAARLASVAEAFLACELIEMVQNPMLLSEDTLRDKKVIFNSTALRISGENNATMVKIAGKPVPVVVLHESTYDGGAGLEHGSLISLGIQDRSRSGRYPKGRLLIILGDPYDGDWIKTIQILDETPRRIKLFSGLVTNEVASVQLTLYKTAGEVLTLLEPLLRQFNTSAVHFVGHSLAGGVASLAATILDGSIAMPKQKSKNSRKIKKNPKTTPPASKEGVNVSTETGGWNSSNSSVSLGETDDVAFQEPLSGLGRARSSALAIGCPPCLSSNVLAAFCTSFVYGDDIVSRTTQDSIQKLVNRMEQALYGGFVSKNLGWMTDTFSLAVSSLQGHAHGSEGEEIKLSIPGRAYLVRPRRLANTCSIHEVGNLKKGGREALREALLWQMHDVLISNSMWKHHTLDSYIHGLDRVQLRGVADEDELVRLE